MPKKKIPDVPKFRIFENRVDPDESYVECCQCGTRCRLNESGVEITIRAPRKPSDMVRDL